MNIPEYRYQMKRIGKISISALLCVIILIIVWLTATNFTSKKDAFINIREGEDYVRICNELDSIASPCKMIVFKTLCSLTGYPNKIRPGHYNVSNVSVMKLFRNMRNGVQATIKYNIPSVNRPEDLAKKMSKAFLADSAQFIQVFKDSAICAKYGTTPQQLFCQIVADQYDFYWYMSPEGFLKKMKNAHNNFWNEKRRQKANDAGLTENEVVILASIVEKETSNEEEKPTIAGLYLNRLKIGMKLQADPTVKFATGNFALRRILNSHLQTPSPYNTYLHEGLPPGPICLPNRNTIDAVLNYENHDYIYMCAKEDFSGKHNFASTYAEHQKNAQKYVDELNKRNIK